MDPSDLPPVQELFPDLREAFIVAPPAPATKSGKDAPGKGGTGTGTGAKKGEQQQQTIITDPQRMQVIPPRILMEYSRLTNNIIIPC